MFPEDREYYLHQKSQQIILERQRYCKQFSISRVHLEEMGGAQRFFPEHAYIMTIEIMATPLRNYGIELPGFSYPLDWWQAFKARWFPAWALKRWPAKMKHVGGGRKELEFRAIFPELDTVRDRYRIEYFVRDPRITEAF